MTPSRPPLSSALAGTELLRWYWLKTELVGLARQLGITTRGDKRQLTARLVAVLDGDQPATPDSPQVVGRSSTLTEPLSTTTVLPAGQRCTQQLRRFFTDHIGPGFHFDAHMREFIRTGAGRTLGEGIEQWQQTRTVPKPPIGPQFELNQFLRDWHHANPHGTHVDALSAWKRHRSTPIDARLDKPTPGTNR